MRELSGMDWAYAFAVLVMTVVSVAVTALSVDGLRARYLGGISGTVTVEQCETNGERWRCRGDFVSDAGEVRIQDVEIIPTYQERPSQLVPADVSSRSASRAWRSDSREALTRLGFGLLSGFGAVIFLVVLLLSRVVQRVEAGIGGGGAGAPPRLASVHPAEEERLLTAVAMERSPTPVRWVLVGYLALVAMVGWLGWSVGFGSGPGPALTMWSGLALLPGVLLVWAWSWRLARWALGTWRAAEPVFAEPLAAALKAEYGAPGMAGCWLRISDTGGRVWHQRVLWSDRLVRYAENMAPSPEPPRAPWEPAAARANAVARRCPGLRRMYLVDIPGVGRLWPASTARSRPPRSYDLARFDRVRRDAAAGGGGPLVAYGVAMVVLVVIAWQALGPLAVGYVPVLVGSGWLWLGANPLAGHASLR